MSAEQKPVPGHHPGAATPPSPPVSPLPPLPSLQSAPSSPSPSSPPSSFPSSSSASFSSSPSSSTSSSASSSSSTEIPPSSSLFASPTARTFHTFDSSAGAHPPSSSSSSSSSSTASSPPPLTGVPRFVEGGVMWVTGERWTQEDNHLVFEDLKASFPDELAGCPLSRLSLFAVFDGHGGPRVSLLLSEWLIKDFLLQAARCTSAAVVGGVLLETFGRLEQAICAYCARMEYYDGSTAVVAVVADDMLYVVNVGDSEAVLSLQYEDHWEAVECTEYHNASNPIEAAKVRARGGFVVDDRVQGTLALSRAFGDIDFKAPWNQHVESFITAEPHVFSFKLTPAARGLILACDGLWDCLSHSESVDLLRHGLRHRLDPICIASNLVTQALDLKSSDNITVLVVLFHYD